MLDGIKRQIIEALVAADKNGLDPVRKFMGMEPYYPSEQSMQMPANMMRQPEARQSMGRFGEVAHNPQMQSMQVPAAAKTDRPVPGWKQEEAQRQAQFEQERQQMREMFPSQQQQERRELAKALMQGVTSDQVAEALPRSPVATGGAMQGVSSDDLIPAGGAQAAPQTYQIARGDTLSALARKFGMSVDQLVALNGIKDPNRIYAGQQLRIG